MTSRRCRGLGEHGRVLIVRATKKLLDRVGPPSLGDEESTTLLGQWYATALFWKPQVALFVSEPTLLPVLMPLAPAGTLLARFPQYAAASLAFHGTPQEVIDEELRQMRDHRLAKTANRSVVGIMNEFTYLAEAYRDDNPGPAGSCDTPGSHALRPPLQQARKSRPRTGRAIALLHNAAGMDPAPPATQIDRGRCGHGRSHPIRLPALFRATGEAVSRRDGWARVRLSCSRIPRAPRPARSRRTATGGLPDLPRCSPARRTPGRWAVRAPCPVRAGAFELGIHVLDPDPGQVGYPIAGY